MKRVTVRLPHGQLEEIESLVDDGQFPTRSEVLREALRKHIDPPDEKTETRRRRRQP